MRQPRNWASLHIFFLCSIISVKRKRRWFTMVLESNNHSVFSLHYHLIFVVKYRRKVIDDTISEKLKEIFEYIQPSYNITLQERNHDQDHVHVLFSAHPKTERTKFINAYKSASSRLIKKEFPEIRRTRRPSVVPKKGIMIPIKVCICLTAFALQYDLFLRYSRNSLTSD